MKLAFIIDPIHLLDPTHDTSVALMESAQVLGHEVWFTQAHFLTVINGQAYSHLQRVNLTPVTLGENRWIADKEWYSLGDRSFLPLESFDAVFMRTDPPVTVNYLYATYILDYINPEKTLVINNPRGIRAANEKMYALQFTQVIPQTIVTQDKDVIKKFTEEKGSTVLKPLGGKGGEGIFFLNGGDRNFNSLVEVSTNWGKTPVMVQEYLPSAQDGDKRIILLNGEPIGAVNRVPTGQDFRGNMAVGGQAIGTEITDRDRFICEQVASKLRQDGLYFVGLDVIGGYLTEVNVTSPTGVREIDRLSNTSLGKVVINWLAERK